MYINTNVAALFAENSLNSTQNTLNSLQQEMSTGYAINSPSDNPSGLAISNLMQGEIGGINAAISNATEATNLLNVANGGMQTDVQIVQEVQQLAVQASNSTNNLQDTQDIQNQISTLLSSLDNVAQTLNYSNQSVLNQGAQGGAAIPSSQDIATIGTASTGFISSVANATIAPGTYTVTAQYTATYVATVASGTVTGITDVSLAQAGVYTINASAAASVSGQNDVSVTVQLSNAAGSVVGTSVFAVSSTAIGGSSLVDTVSLDGTNVGIQVGSLSYSASTSVTATVTGTYSLSFQSYNGTTTVTAGATTFSSTAAPTGSYAINVGGATVSMNLGSIAAAAPTVATGGVVTDSLTQSFNVTSPLVNLAVGADSGNLASGLYTVSMSYSSVGSGTDVITVTGASGVVASGSVGNLSSVSGTVTLQLVSGDNSSGPNSFVLTVNQNDIANSQNPIVQAVSVTAAQQYVFQTGPNQGNGNAVTLGFGSFNSTTLGLASMNVTTTQGAQYAVTQSQLALSMLTNAQGQVGAQVDQLNYTTTNLQTETTNLQASQSTIMDANMAQVTSQFAQEQILMQTGIQALSTSQQLPSLVLKLLS